MAVFAKNTSRGFTLIELVVVIVLIGILSAVAAPKFVDLNEDAIAAKLEAMSGALKSANELVHAKAIVANVANKAESEIVVEGINISITYGYITASKENIMNVLNADITSLKSATSSFTSDYGIFEIDVLVHIVADKNGADASNVLGCALSYTVLSVTQEPYYKLNTSSCGGG